MTLPILQVFSYRKVVGLLLISYLLNIQTIFAQNQFLFISGNNNVFVGSTETYYISGGTGDVIWDLYSGGSITNVNSNEGSITIQWQDIGTHTLSAVVQDNFGNYSLVSNFYITVSANNPPTPTGSFTISGNPCGNKTITTSNLPSSPIAWYWQTSSTGMSLTNNANTAYTVSANGTYYLRAYNSTYGLWSNAPQLVNITNLNPYPAPPTISNKSGFGSVSVSVQSQNGYSYYWYNAQGVVSSDSPADYKTLNSTQTWYVSAKNTTTGCESLTRTTVIGTVYTLPLIQSSKAPSNPPSNNLVTLSRGEALPNLSLNATYPSNTTYTWFRNGTQVSSNTGTTSTYTPTLTGVYTVLVSISDGNTPISTTSAAFSVYRGVEGQDLNYIINRTIVREGVNTETEIDNLAVGEVIEQITYFDGLGRPMQNVVTQASPSQKDIIQPIQYDAFGRQPRSFLPYTQDNTGRYRPNAVKTNETDYLTSEQYSFYNSANTPVNVTKDAKPFTFKVFENSPMSRVLQSTGVGANWHDNNRFSQGDYAVYQKASHSQVQIWTYEYPSPTYPQGRLLSNNTQFYGDNQLLLTDIQDEEGSRVRQFVNKSGQVILKQAFGEGAEILETYYIYDDFGQLRGVIPPKAVDELKTKNWDLTGTCNQCKDNYLNTYLYLYNYDERGRLIEKKEPQANWSYVVYDDLDRPVLSQDGKQAQQNEWAFTKYDVLSRPVLTGLLNTPQTRTQLQTEAGAIPTYTPQAMEISDPANFSTLTLPSDASKYVANGTSRVYTASTSIDMNAGDYISSNTLDYVFQLGTKGGGSTNSYSLKISTFPVLSSDDEILSYSFYDDYDYNEDGLVDAKDLGNRSYQAFTGGPSTPFTRTLGAVTGSKVKVLDESRYTNPKWLSTVPYYDDKGRMAQVQADNHLNNATGRDVLNAQYHTTLRGRLNEDLLTHNGGVQQVQVKQTYTYDFIGRPLSMNHQVTLGTTTSPLERIAAYTYNELGQVVQKKVGNNDLQVMDYAFNIRGWLTKINDANLSDSKDLFGFELAYEATGTGLDLGNGVGQNKFNGNIAGQKWMSALDRQQRTYSYKYDRLNRLIEAKYRNVSTPTAPEKFSISNLTYDQNGNILSMQREGLVSISTPTVGNLSGMNFGTVDNLTYKYNGNQLVAVNDGATANTGVAGDFQDNGSSYAYNTADATSSHEYQYDVNGSAKLDKNKGIGKAVGANTGLIQYNYLGLVSTIIYDNGNTLEYTYDAVGIKLRKVATEGGTATTTDYVGGMVYENYALQFIKTGEGRALAPGTTPEGNTDFAYEYSYTDHLGNLRMAFREGKETLPFVATMENADTKIAEKEEREFANIAYTRDATYHHGTTGTQSAKVNAGLSKSLGPWKSIPVRQGDVITPEVWAYYVNPSNTIFANTKLSASLNPNTNPNPAYGTTGTGIDTKLPTFPLNNITIGITQNLLNTPTTANTIPNAYLALLFYNENGMLSDQKYVPLLSSSAAWQKLALPAIFYTVPSKGRVEIFVANESNTDVWFDDLSIKYQGGIIAQEMHYDPWGLELRGIGKDGKNNFTFNAQSEKQKDLNGGKGYFYETDWRGYDAQLGRFHGMDALASMYSGISPYQFAFNNPISFNDPTGLEPCPDGKCGDSGGGESAAQGKEESGLSASSGGSNGSASVNPIASKGLSTTPALSSTVTISASSSSSSGKSSGDGGKNNDTGSQTTIPGAAGLSGGNGGAPQGGNPPSPSSPNPQNNNNEHSDKNSKSSENHSGCWFCEKDHSTMEHISEDTERTLQLMAYSIEWWIDNLDLSSKPKKAPLGEKIADATTQIVTAKLLVLFSRAKINYTEHFKNRIITRASRGITEKGALRAYNKGRLYYNPATKNYIRHDPTTKISVVVDKPVNGEAITVFEGNASPDWQIVKFRK